MATFPVAMGARLLGIHPKTLHHWLKAAEFPLAAHPTDARLKCVAAEHLLELARQHGRPLPTLSSAAALDGYATASLAEEQAKPLPAHEAASASLADLIQQLSQLHIQLACVQQHLTGLMLTFLQERTGHDGHLQHQRLCLLEEGGAAVPRVEAFILTDQQRRSSGSLPCASTSPVACGGARAFTREGADRIWRTRSVCGRLSEARRPFPHP